MHYLRSLGDSRAIIAAADKRPSRRGALARASSASKSPRRSASVDSRCNIVGLETQPLERVLGPELGEMIRLLHESHGVVFHMGETATAIGDTTVTLKGGAVLPADLVVIGIGVRPDIALAEAAGLSIDRGVLVNEYLETSVPGIFAAGDIARWPDPHTGQRIRVEHWVVAEQQGQVAGRNMLMGSDPSALVPFEAAPFFWSRHYDKSIRYVGHAERWDEIAIDGDISAGNAKVTYLAGGKALAVATIGRDRENLTAELAMEGGQPAVTGALAGV